MANKGYSRRNWDGGYTHYDAKGHKTGESRPNWGGGYTEYNARGKKVGETRPNWSGGFTHYDEKGHKTGESRYSFGGISHYDSKGHKVGESSHSWGDSYSHNDRTEGCYIATCVYGSYDCPEVWTLRQFRDEILGKSILGRLFIRAYYALSPLAVRRLGNRSWFRRIWKTRLDWLVDRLGNCGLSGTPYRDRDWRRWGIRADKTACQRKK